jgi:hypothetical protein
MKLRKAGKEDSVEVLRDYTILTSDNDYIQTFIQCLFILQMTGRHVLHTTSHTY